MILTLLLVPLVAADYEQPGAADDLFIIGFDRLLNGRQLLGTINAKISHLGDSVTLQCVGKASAENITWWRFSCSGGSPGRVHLTRDVLTKSPENYELLTSRTAGIVSSSLRIKKLNAEDVSGLYRCGPQNTEITHYFVVGRKTSLGSCFRFGALLKAIQSFVGAAANRARTDEYILKLPGAGAEAHEYRIRFSEPDLGGGRRSARIARFTRD